jgi:hypothetical protein
MLGDVPRRGAEDLVGLLSLLLVVILPWAATSLPSGFVDVIERTPAPSR